MTCHSDLDRIRCLLDLETEESLADLWSEFQLTPGQAMELVNNTNHQPVPPPGIRKPIQSQQRKRRAA